jgi:hypothetical protein
VIWIRDGRPVYRRAVRQVYRDAQPTGKRGRPPLAPTPGVGLIQAVKRRHRGRMVRVEVRPVLGEAVDGPYPVHEERLNGVLRDRLNALSRKTHAFAKTVETWDALVILLGLTQLAGRDPHIWRVIGQNTPYMAVRMTQLGPNCVTPTSVCLSITGCGRIGPCGKRRRACRRGGGIGRGRQRWPLGGPIPSGPGRNS